MTKTFRNISIILAALFVVFAAVQYNDPDSLGWIILYLAAAFLCVLATKGKMPYFVPAIAGILFVYGAITQWPPVYEGISLADGFTPSIEEARESLGLLICTAAMAYLSFGLYQKKRRIMGSS